jgi:hypothetical protein
LQAERRRYGELWCADHAPLICVTNLALPICRVVAKLNDHELSSFAKSLIWLGCGIDKNAGIFSDLICIGNVVTTGLTIYVTSGQFWPYQIGADN